MKLHTYINEILDIAKAEHMSMDVAVNMFLANVKNAGDSSLPHYKGADHVDYAALKPHVKELEESWPAFRETDIRLLDLVDLLLRIRNLFLCICGLFIQCL